MISFLSNINFSSVLASAGPVVKPVSPDTFANKVTNIQYLKYEKALPYVMLTLLLTVAVFTLILIVGIFLKSAIIKKLTLFFISSSLFSLIIFLGTPIFLGLFRYLQGIKH